MPEQTHHPSSQVPPHRSTARPHRALVHGSRAGAAPPPHETWLSRPRARPKARRAQGVRQSCQPLTQDQGFPTRPDLHAASLHRTTTGLESLGRRHARFEFSLHDLGDAWQARTGGRATSSRPTAWPPEPSPAAGHRRRPTVTQGRSSTGNAVGGAAPTAPPGGTCASDRPPRRRGSPFFMVPPLAVSMPPLALVHRPGFFTVVGAAVTREDTVDAVIVQAGRPGYGLIHRQGHSTDSG